METSEKKQQKESIRLERLLGIILLIPPIIGVLLFILNLYSNEMGRIVELRNLTRMDR